MSEGDDVWCEVEAIKGSLVSVYRGRMSRAHFDAWSKGTIERGVVTLNDTYWSYDDGDGNEGWVVVGVTPGPYARALGTTHIRADLVLVIVPLLDGAEREAHKLRPTTTAEHDDFD